MPPKTDRRPRRVPGADLAGNGAGRDASTRKDPMP
jgi:hypothetical protein